MDFINSLCVVSESGVDTIEPFAQEFSGRDSCCLLSPVSAPFGCEAP